MTTTRNTSRRALLAGAPAAAAGALAAGTAVNAVAVAMAKAAEVDPMLAAVDRFKAAVEARIAILDAEEEILDAEEDLKGEWEKADTKSFKAEWNAFHEMLDTTPTSIAGIVAVLDVLGNDPYDVGNRSAASWAYGGSEVKCPLDRLMLEMAEMLRGQA
jgi:ABC-type glycerol-3-phosphate transport system substrate-binding protein